MCALCTHDRFLRVVGYVYVCKRECVRVHVRVYLCSLSACPFANVHRLGILACLRALRGACVCARGGVCAGVVWYVVNGGFVCAYVHRLFCTYVPTRLPLG